ncbi:hypothetical protein CY652_00015 [Burkholderia sp. WAC0059]|uniref:hypothetical protein n=1 Tax=Burkholderia sp. WAC0059 TaxID=2066022 RepID=UPI000C7F4E5A|nr:hypothetical protein [Burkholderia sp. WAC0059]PLZ04115.1 hypothetical protein CY652_00015 [Burkholderia sp. WAC0059]
MARTPSFSRAPQQGGRARRSKAMLLPIPRASANGLALQVHLALAALHGSGGTRQDAQTLLHTLALASAIADAGYGSIAPGLMAAAEAAVTACFSNGRETGRWRLDDAAFDAFSQVVTVYDRQLQTAPLWALTEASQWLERLSAGEPRAQAVHADDAARESC